MKYSQEGKILLYHTTFSVKAHHWGVIFWLGLPQGEVCTKIIVSLHQGWPVYEGFHRNYSACEYRTKQEEITIQINMSLPVIFATLLGYTLSRQVGIAKLMLVTWNWLFLLCLCKGLWCQCYCSVLQKYVNAAIAKHRTQSRGKQRDKRAVLW